MGQQALCMDRAAVGPKPTESTASGSASSHAGVPFGPLNDSANDGLPLWIAVRIVKAELFRSFATIRGLHRMAPYVVVDWWANGVKHEVARTRKDSGIGLSFQWNHTCRQQPYPPEGRVDEVEFAVFQERFRGMIGANLCGKVRVVVDKLLLGCGKPVGETQFVSAPTVDLTLRKNAEDTGVITIQALLVRHANGSCNDENVALTCADPGMFEGDVRRLGVSGGTAPFFRLELKPGAAPHLGSRWSKEYYIGKDLSHARDEVNFYEEALEASRQPGGGGLDGMHRFMFEYAGILSCTVKGTSGQHEPAELLVMRNLRDGCKSFRMLDIKMGQQTAAAGWQGKSRVAAIRQSLLDGVTNSSEEGFRLEGFDGAPPVLSSLDPMLDVAALGEQDRGFQAKMRKMAMRIMLQRMSASEILMHFADVHQVPEDPGDEALATVLAPVELAEIVIHQVIVRLVDLALACRLVPVPQKWIGSSVALGFDCGHLPLRSQPESAVREAVRVQIFDWGRSELNTLKKHMSLSDDEQTDRALFWGHYKGGIDRLLWESMRMYWHRFGNSKGWDQACITVYDFDSMTDNDIIGKVTFDLKETTVGTVPLLDARGMQGLGPGGASTVTFSVTYRPLPAKSRLAGTWRIHIARATNLKACDRLQGRPASDPFAMLRVSSPDGKHSFAQQTSVVANSLNPIWDETLEVPVAGTNGMLEDALSCAAAGLGGQAARDLCAERVSPLLPPEDISRAEVEQAIGGWRARLDWAATASSGAAHLRGTSSERRAFSAERPHGQPLVYTI